MTNHYLRGGAVGNVSWGTNAYVGPEGGAYAGGGAW